MEHVSRLLQGTPLALAPLDVRAAGASGPDSLMDGLWDFLDVGSVQIVESGAPLADLAWLGQTLLNLVVLALAALTTAAAASGSLEAIPIIGDGLDKFQDAWQVLGGFVTTVLMVVTGAGLVLAFLLPLMPFMRFLAGILAWVLDVVEAIAAVPLWLTAHLGRSRDELIPSGARGGWLLLLGIVARPALMILGLILGYLAFAAGVRLLNRLWLAGITGAEGSPTVAPGQWLVYLVIYTLIVWGMCNVAFSAIDRLPAAILRWVGVPGGTAVDEGGVESSIRRAATPVGQTVANVAGKAGGAVAKR